MTIRNAPGFLGINLQETRIFGARIHPLIQKGLSIDRATARECRAWLRDAAGEHIALLWWRVDGDKMVNVIDLETGQSASLMLFAHIGSAPPKYFAYEPESGNSTAPKIPPDDVRMQDTRTFLVHIDYSYGRQKLDVSVRVKKGYDGRLTWSHKGGGGGF
jgi:hypothetical protein